MVNRIYNGTELIGHSEQAAFNMSIIFCNFAVCKYLTIS